MATPLLEVDRLRKVYTRGFLNKQETFRLEADFTIEQQIRPVFSKARVRKIGDSNVRFRPKADMLNAAYYGRDTYRSLHRSGRGWSR